MRGPPLLRTNAPTQRPMPSTSAPLSRGLGDDEKKKIRSLLEDLVGTRAAVLLDQKINVLGKVPLAELESTLKSLSGGVYAVVFDGEVDKLVAGIAERNQCKYLIAMDSKIGPRDTRVTVLTEKQI